MGVILLPEIVETAIQAFIQDTGGSNGGKIVQPDASGEVGKKRYKKSTNIINRKNISVTKGEMVFKESGIGVLREISVIADQKINPLIELDGKQPFGARSEWDDLSDITLYSTTVMARLVGSSYVLSLNNLYFKHDLSLFVWFNTDTTISAIFGVYDLCEVL